MVKRGLAPPHTRFRVQASPCIACGERRALARREREERPTSAAVRAFAGAKAFAEGDAGGGSNPEEGSEGAAGWAFITSSAAPVTSLVGVNVVVRVGGGDGDGDVNVSAARNLQRHPAEGRACSASRSSTSTVARWTCCPSARRSPRRVPKGFSGLTDQLHRAALSVPLNIAEAAGRNTEPDAARHYAIARGSAMECAAIIDRLRLLQVIDDDAHARSREPSSSWLASSPC